MAAPNWHQLAKEEADTGERWTIVWDTRRQSIEDANKAVEKTQAAALDRAKHLLQLGFIVHEIKGPGGAVWLEEVELLKRYRPAQDGLKGPPIPGEPIG